MHAQITAAKPKSSQRRPPALANTPPREANLDRHPKQFPHEVARPSARFSPKAVCWKLLTLLCIGLVYWTVNSEGIRLSMPVFATPLRKLPVPLLSYLRHWEYSYRFDLAHLFALFMLFAVFHLLVLMTRITLFGKDAPGLPKRIDLDLYTRIVFALGIIFVVGDCLLFFVGVRHHAGSWGGANFLVAVVATTLYLTVLGFVSFMYVVLESESQGSRRKS